LGGRVGWCSEGETTCQNGGGIRRENKGTRDLSVDSGAGSDGDGGGSGKTAGQWSFFFLFTLGLFSSRKVYD